MTLLIGPLETTAGVVFDHALAREPCVLRPVGHLSELLAALGVQLDSTPDLAGQVEGVAHHLVRGFPDRLVHVVMGPARFDGQRRTVRDELRGDVQPACMMSRASPGSYRRRPAVR